MIARAMRFAFRMTWIGRVLLAPFGAARDSYVDLGAHGFRVRLGRLFDQELPYSAVESVTPDRWPLWGGIGVRVGAGEEAGVISSTGRVVRIRLRAPIALPIAFGLRKSVRALVLSVAEPDQLLAALARGASATSA